MKHKTCENCDRMIPLYQIPRYFETMMVCERCFYKLREKGRMERKDVKCLMVGLI